MVGSRSNMQSDISNGINSINQYYGEAGNYMSPYTSYANEDFGTGRDTLFGYGSQQMSNPHYNQQFYNEFLDMTPDQLLNQAMSGYAMSPIAQQQMKLAMSGLTNAMAASGQLGSGRNAAMAAELGNSVINQDMGKYLKMKQGAFNTQQSVLDQFNQQNKYLASLFQDMVGTENKASSSMAQNAMRAAQMSSNLWRTAATQEKNYRPMNNLASLVGAGLEAYLTMGMSTAAKQAGKAAGKGK